VESVQIATAQDDGAPRESNVIVLDSDLGGAMAFVQEIAVQPSARMLLCLHDATTADRLAAIARGSAARSHVRCSRPRRCWLRGVAAGIFAFDIGIVRTLSSAAASVGTREGAVVGNGGFAPREQMVLSLVAAGLSNRGIASRLSDSERTIKTIFTTRSVSSASRAGPRRSRWRFASGSSDGASCRGAG
jgi:DNA-binding NarL/FixJ family response regulator